MEKIFSVCLFHGSKQSSVRSAPGLERPLAPFFVQTRVSSRDVRIPIHSLCERQEVYLYNVIGPFNTPGASVRIRKIQTSNRERDPTAS